MSFVDIHWRHYNVRMEIEIQTILPQIIAHCAGTHDINLNQFEIGHFSKSLFLTKR